MIDGQCSLTALRKLARGYPRERVKVTYFLNHLKTSSTRAAPLGNGAPLGVADGRRKMMMVLPALMAF